MALQSGLKSELTWALNALTLLSFKEKDEVRKDATPLAKIPGLLDALLQIDDWCDIALPRVLTKKPRVRVLDANSAVTGFGSEYKTVNPGDSVPHPTLVGIAWSSDIAHSGGSELVEQTPDEVIPSPYNFTE